MLRIGTILDKEFNFPIQNELTIVIGENGSGKSLALKKLKEYFEEQNENVIYFPDFRILKGNPDEIKGIILNKIVFDKLENIKFEYDDEYLNYLINNLDEYIDQYIGSGYIQIINFLYNILKEEKESIVIIDTPETNLSIFFQKTLLNNILNLGNVKKIIVCTHSPSIINNWDSCINITECLNLYE